MLSALIRFKSPALLSSASAWKLWTVKYQNILNNNQQAAGLQLGWAGVQDTDLGVTEYEPPGGGGDALHLLLRQVAGVETQVGHLLAIDIVGQTIYLSLIIESSLTNRKQLWIWIIS